jgi:hypothetical protein
MISPIRNIFYKVSGCLEMPKSTVLHLFVTIERSFFEVDLKHFDGVKAFNVGDASVY